MTPAQHDPQDPRPDLNRTLSRQAERFAERGGAPIELEKVLVRAGKIRRARRVRTSMAMAAVVLAIAVPVGIQVVGENDPTKTPRTPEFALAADTDPISLGDLGTGAAPKVGYLADGTLHHGDDVIPLSESGTPIELARIDGGFLVGLNNDDTGELMATFVPDDASGGQSWPLQGGFAVSADGNVGAFLQPDGTVTAVQDGGAAYYEVGKVPDGDESSWGVAAVVGENCAGGASAEDDCEIFLEDGGRNPSVGLVRPGRDLVPVRPRLQRLVDITGAGAAAGMVSATDEGSCSEVEDDAGATVWETCENFLGSFSPNGRYLLGRPAYLDGFGDGSMAVLDARTGAPVLNLGTTTESTITSVVWEDDGHVLATVFESGRWAVERIALNGGREYALEPVAGADELVQPLRVAQR